MLVDPKAGGSWLLKQADFAIVSKIGQFVILRRILKYLSIRMECASCIVRNLSNRTGQKSAKITQGRKSGKYA